MFWDNVAGVYDVFVYIINGRTHRKLREIIVGLIRPEDSVLECACGTGFLSAVIAPRCNSLIATDFSKRMLKRAEKNCAVFRNVEFREADILSLPFPDDSFDKVVAGNVIHLLGKPLTALHELDRVCRPSGKLIIPTYMNRDSKDKTNVFASTVGKAGADFKRQFTVESYQQFFMEAGYEDVQITLAEGRIPCAVAVIKKPTGDS